TISIMPGKMTDGYSAAPVRSKALGFGNVGGAAANHGSNQTANGKTRRLFDAAEAVEALFFLYPFHRLCRLLRFLLVRRHFVIATGVVFAEELVRGKVLGVVQKRCKVAHPAEKFRSIWLGGLVRVLFGQPLVALVTWGILFRCLRSPFFESINGPLV